MTSQPTQRNTVPDHLYYAGLSDGTAYPETAREREWKADMCKCGHPVGDHKSRGTRFPHPPQYGFCYARGCGCRHYEQKEVR